jgi:hypothetical protein
MTVKDTVQYYKYQLLSFGYEPVVSQDGRGVLLKEVGHRYPEGYAPLGHITARGSRAANALLAGFLAGLEEAWRLAHIPAKGRERGKMRRLTLLPDFWEGGE